MVNVGVRHRFAGDRGTVGVYVYVPFEREADEDQIGGGVERAADS